MARTRLGGVWLLALLSTLFLSTSLNNIRQLTGPETAQAQPPLKLAHTAVLTSASDSYLKDGGANQNQSGETLLRLRSSGRNRALVAFSAEELAAALAGNTLVSARIELSVSTNGGNWGDGRTVDIHRLTAAWAESAVTWNCPSDSNLGNQNGDCPTPWDGGAFEPAATGSVLHTNSTAGTVSFDVTADLEAALAGAPFHGWLLKKTDEGAPGLIDYASREVCGQEPRLVLEIEAPAADITAPRLLITSPGNRFLVNQQQPTLALSFFDAGSPLNFSSLLVQLDGVNVTSTCTVCSSRAFCPSPTLAEGPHLLAASIRDSANNTATTSLAFDVFLGDGEHRLTLPAVADTYLRDGSPNQNQGGENLLRIRSSGKNRALVHFDLAGVTELVDTLHSATLELSIATNGNNWGTTGRTVDAHDLTSNWSELGATWNCASDANPANSQPDCSPQWNGGSFETVASDSVTITNGLAGWVQLDVTADVLASLAGGPHHGWLLKKTFENQNGLVEFSSKEGTAAQAPRLILTFDGGEAPDTEAPTLAFTAPPDGSLLATASPQLGLSFADVGTGVDTNTLVVRLAGAPLAVGCSFTSSTATCVPSLPLPEGALTLSATVADFAGNVSAPAARPFTVDTVAPAAVNPEVVAVTAPVEGSIVVSAPAGSAEPGATLRVTNTRTGAVVDATITSDGSFSTSLASEADDVLSLTVMDAAGNTSAAAQVVVPRPVDPNLPPDPATVAPPLDRTVATDLFTATEFLYTGTNPIQTGVAAGTIDARRVAVLRGRVLDRAGQPLPGVTITVHQHPELGQTKSRADGAFDLVVNGGGVLTVNYEKTGYLSLQRQITARWRDYAWFEDVVMTPYDSEVTAITAGSPVAQVARGSVEMDLDGARRATLVFPANSSFNLRLADGTSQPLASMMVRATEYTVGESGPEAMPAPLPPGVGYTYAVELSADEAIAAGARSVELSQPAFLYLENFLGVFVGQEIPVGFYDSKLAAWVGSDNGRVVRLVGTDASGRAELDLEGQGLAASAVELAALGFTDEERRALVNLYSVGQSLWRAAIPHFTPIDLNWPMGPPPLLPEEMEDPPSDDPPGEGRDDEDEPDCTGGSVIECQNQTLGERLGVVGTPFDLRYGSDRMPGRASAFSVDIQVTGPTVPSILKKATVEVAIAGRVERREFAPLPNQVFRFTWDGKDAYGRRLQGAQPLSIQRRFHYDYNFRPAPPTQRSWARFSRESISIGPPSRQTGLGELTLGHTRTGWVDLNARGSLGTFDAQALGLGGWTLDAHHVWDHTARKLYLGSGGRQSASGLPPLLYGSVGTGEFGYSGDGGPAPLAEIARPAGLAYAPDGSLYFADRENHVIRRVSPAGIITTVAGTGTECPEVENGDPTACGERVPSTEAQLREPNDVAVAPNGDLLIADEGNNCVRRVSAENNLITTLAGQCDGGFGDGPIKAKAAGGPAIAPRVTLGCDDCPGPQAELRSPTSVAVAADGLVLIADRGNNRIRGLSPDGLLYTYAGGGSPISGNGDGGPALEASLLSPRGLALAPDGTLFIAQSSAARIREVSPSGTISTVAGSGFDGYCGDGGPARVACLSFPVDVALAPDGSLLIADANNRLVRKVTPSRVIHTVAGRPQNLGGTFTVPGTPAQGMDLNFPVSVAVSPDGSVVFGVDAQVLRVGGAFEGSGAAEIVIPDRNGGSVYVFDRDGRHLRTVDPLTGVTELDFSYNGQGLLSEVRDRDGLRTTLTRDGSGRVSAITSPFGQVSQLGHDGNGYLASFVNPATETSLFSYSADGLMMSMTDPRGFTRHYGFAGLGRLVRAEDPAGGVKTLDRTNSGSGYRVELTSPLGRVSRYDVNPGERGEGSHLRQSPTGGVTLETTERDGARRSVLEDDTSLEMRRKADPRWGFEAPLPGVVELSTPSGLTAEVRTSLAVALADPDDPLSLTAQTETFTVNGREFREAYDANTRQLTSTTAAGRIRTTQLDLKGRPVSISIPVLAPLEISYDAMGRASELAQGTGSERRTLSLSYDASGWLSSLTDPLGQTASLTRDAAGRVTQVALPGGRNLTLSFDAHGNPTTLTPPGQPAHNFTYNPVDLPATYQAPIVGADPATTTYSHNLDRQVTTQVAPGGETTTVSYDTAGRASQLSTPDGAYGVTYVPQTEKLATLASPDGVTLSYGYDGFLLTSSSWSGTVNGGVTRAFNNDFRLSEERVNGAHPASFTYDPDGLLTQAGDTTLTYRADNGLLESASIGSVTTHWARNSFGEMASATSSVGATPLLSTTYTRDKLGRIVEKSETVEGVTGTFTYSYNEAGRLAEVRRDGNTLATYTYDANGNRLSDDGTFGSAASSYDAQDRLIQYGDTTYTFDAKGDLVSKSANGQTVTYDYDAMGGLSSVTLASGIEIDYVLDGRGRRVGKKINGVLVQGFLYRDALRLAAELDGTGAVTSRFVYGSRYNLPDTMVKGGVTYAFLADHLGSPRLVVNAATGAVAQRLDYDEFGRVTLDTNPGFQPFGFAGGLSDPQTGLVRFGARDYDPEVGRWTVKDPIGFGGGASNLYEYVGNDPVNFVDLTGLYSILAGAGVNATLIVGAEASAGVFVNPGGFRQQPDAGVFGSVGFTQGLSIGADAFAGVVFGEACNIPGPTTNVNIGLGPLSLSLFFSEESGEWLGGTLGWGPSFPPINGSLSNATTGAVSLAGL